MAVAPMSREQQKAAGGSRGPMQRFFFKEGFPGTLVIPNSKGGDTVIRVYPQHTSDGGALPAITRFVEVGEDRIPELSNLEMAYTTMGQGQQETQRFTGLVVPLEWDNTQRQRPQLDSPVSGLYVKLKGAANKHELTPAQQAELTRLTVSNPVMKIFPILSSPEETYFVSCMILKVAGVAQKPDTKGILILRGGAATVYCQAVKRAWERAEAAVAADPTKPFVDPFSVEGGVCFTFSVLPIDITQGRQKAVISCVAGLVGFDGTQPAGYADLESKAKPAPIPEKVAHEGFIDVNQWFQRHSWETLMAAALKMYGRVAVQAGIPTQLEEYEGLLANRHAVGGGAAPVVAPVTTTTTTTTTTPAVAPPAAAKPAAASAATAAAKPAATTVVAPATATGVENVDDLLAALADLDA